MLLGRTNKISVLDNRCPPQSRWWNRDNTRRIIAYICWIIAFILAAVGMWSNMAGENVSGLPQWLGILSSFLPIILLLGGGFLIAFGTETKNNNDTRIVLVPLAIYFIASGGGALLGSYQSERGITWVDTVFVVFVCGGVATIILSQLFYHRAQQNALYLPDYPDHKAGVILSRK